MQHRHDPDHREQRFIEEYLVDGNGARSVMASGYKAKNLNSAGVLASRLLSRPIVGAEIERRQKEIVQKHAVNADRVLGELVRVAFADPGELMEWDDNGIKLRPSKDLSAEQRRMVSEVSSSSSKDGTNVRVKMHDKLNALGKLALHTGLLSLADRGVGPLAEDPLLGDPIAEFEATMKAMNERMTVERVTVTERVIVEKGRG